jgi:hypothetical protein
VVTCHAAGSIQSCCGDHFPQRPNHEPATPDEKCQRPCEEWFLDILYPYLVVTTMWFIHKLWLDTHRSPQTFHKIA